MKISRNLNSYRQLVQWCVIDHILTGWNNHIKHCFTISRYKFVFGKSLFFFSWYYLPLHFNGYFSNLSWVSWYWNVSSEFYWSYWWLWWQKEYKMCKARVKSSQPTTPPSGTTWLFIEQMSMSKSFCNSSSYNNNNV